MIRDLRLRELYAKPFDMDAGTMNLCSQLLAGSPAAVCDSGILISRSVACV
jgi:hypothetical protein